MDEDLFDYEAPELTSKMERYIKNPKNWKYAIRADPLSHSEYVQREFRFILTPPPQDLVDELLKQVPDFIWESTVYTKAGEFIEKVFEEYIRYNFKSCFMAEVEEMYIFSAFPEDEKWGCPLSREIHKSFEQYPFMYQVVTSILFYSYKQAKNTEANPEIYKTTVDLTWHFYSDDFGEKKVVEINDNRQSPETGKQQEKEEETPKTPVQKKIRLTIPSAPKKHWLSGHCDEPPKPEPGFSRLDVPDFSEFSSIILKNKDGETIEIFSFPSSSQGSSLLLLNKDGYIEEIFDFSSSQK